MKQLILAFIYATRKWLIAVFCLGVLALVGWSLPTVFWPVVALSAIVGAIAGAIAMLMGIVAFVFSATMRRF